MVVGGIVFSGLGQFLAMLLYHTMDMYAASSPAGYMRIVQSFGSIGMFWVPAMLFAHGQDGMWWNFESANRRPHFLFMNVVLVLSIGIIPLVSLLEQWNGAIHLPESMSGIQQWMDRMEEESQLLIALATYEHTIPTLLLNILVLAVIPACCEEFLFRGALQPALLKWTRNPHLAIWLTAFIFSTIHLQFAGFIPRFLLGAYLGYLIYWSRSLWLPILAHALHNTWSLFITYVMEGRGVMMEDIKFTDIHGATTMAVTSFVVVLMGLVFMWRTHKELNVSSTDRSA